MEALPLILVVEDNPTEQKVLTLLLSKFGYQAVVTPTGAAAVASIEAGEQTFSLILMDWQLLDMDGLECTRRIRVVQRRQGRLTPIIAVTAHAMLGDKQKCLNAGMDDYLSKPFTANQLESMITRWSQQQQSLTG